MTKAPVTLQDLQRKIYTKAKADPSWRFWGLYVHVCKLETLRTAYQLAKANDGAPGIDGVTFAAIETAGAEDFLAQLLAHRAGRVPARSGHDPAIDDQGMSSDPFGRIAGQPQRGLRDIMRPPGAPTRRSSGNRRYFRMSLYVCW